MRGFDWDGFAGIGTLTRIKDSPHLPQDAQRRLVEDQWHEMQLLRTDPVLPGDRATDLDACAHYLGRGPFDSIHEAGISLIEIYVGMQIAVARVKHVAYRQIVLCGDRGHLLENIG